MISLIIPTMWRHEPFLDFFPRLLQIDCINDIVIINNDKSRFPDIDAFKDKKINVYTPESNLFVNPSWNLGASLAKNDWMCFLSDDLNFDTRVFYEIRDFVQKDDDEIGMIGLLTPYLDESTYHKFFTDGEIDLVYCNEPDDEKRPNTTGIGNLFFIHKRDWKDIPSDLKIFHGEVLQWQRINKYKRNYVITNCRAETPWHVTWHSLASDPNTDTEFQRIQISDQKLAESMNFTFD